MLDAFLDAGFDFIDTADVYSRWVAGNTGGESETIIGRWMRERGNRDRVVIATKVGAELGPDAKGLSRAYIIRAVEASLKRLQTDTIDLYQSHRDDLNTPVEETLEAYRTLIEAGKVRVIGASNFSPGRLNHSLDRAEAKSFPRYDSLQPEYNLYTRAAFEAELQPLCLRREVGVIPYFALASGFLTGKYRSDADAGKSARGQNIVQTYLNPKGLRILDALDGVADQHGTAPGAVALAWLMAQPCITAPIASATSIDQVATLASAATLALSSNDIAALNLASTT